MSVFIAAQDHDLLQRNRLDSFDADRKSVV